MRIAVTGATGYIGARLVQLARRQGHLVSALSRHPPAAADVDWLPYDLDDTGPLELPAGTGAVVHLAAATAAAGPDAGRELAAAQRLLDAVRRQGARLVFVSSQTANAKAPSSYGRSKWQVEQLCLAAGATAVRPGQVFGASEQALFGVLAAAARRLPVLPAFMPGPSVQPIHVDDLASGLLRCCTQPDLAGSVLCLAQAAPVGFTRFLNLLAAERVRRPRLFVPVPVALVRLGARLLGPARSARLGLDRLLSLFALAPMMTAPDLARIGLVLRPLEAGMTRSGTGRRLRLREARALLRYVLREPPAAALLRRQVRAVETLAGGTLLGLPGLLLRHPRLIALVDGAPGDSGLAWHLQAATVVAEASPQGARRCLQLGRPGGALRQLARLGRAALAEAGWRGLALLLAAPLRARLSRRPPS